MLELAGARRAGGWKREEWRRTTCMVIALSIMSSSSCPCMVHIIMGHGLAWVMAMIFFGPSSPNQGSPKGSAWCVVLAAAERTTCRRKIAILSAEVLLLSHCKCDTSERLLLSYKSIQKERIACRNIIINHIPLHFFLSKSSSFRNKYRSKLW